VLERCPRGMTSGMPDSTTQTRAKSSDKDFVSRLTDAGEEALQKLAELPGGQRAVSAFNDLRNRVDELGRKVRGIDELQERVAKLEKEVASLKRAGTSARRSTAPRSRPKPPSST
jgi:phage shock protein A